MRCQLSASEGLTDNDGLERKRTLSRPNAELAYLGKSDGYEIYEETNLSTGSKRRDYFYLADDGGLIHAVQSIGKVTVERALGSLDVRYVYDIAQWPNQKAIDASVAALAEGLVAK